MTNCRHCGRTIIQDHQLGMWVDPEATGDDAVWRETCDSHDTFVADHEPDLATDAWEWWEASLDTDAARDLLAELDALDWIADHPTFGAPRLPGEPDYREAAE